MNKLPLTVIGGYLGAGKTTLINRLLSESHDARVMVMVNDFGAVNIDAALLARADGDTIELTNGCVCCTLGADLFMAIGDWRCVGPTAATRSFGDRGERDRRPGKNRRSRARPSPR